MDTPIDDVFVSFAMAEERRSRSEKEEAGVRKKKLE
jgi:hypothetical protein